MSDALIHWYLPQLRLCPCHWKQKIIYSCANVVARVCFRFALRLFTSGLSLLWTQFPSHSVASLSLSLTLPFPVLCGSSFIHSWNNMGLKWDPWLCVLCTFLRIPAPLTVGTSHVNYQLRYLYTRPRYCPWSQAQIINQELDSISTKKVPAKNSSFVLCALLYVPTHRQFLVSSPAGHKFSFLCQEYCPFCFKPFPGIFLLLLQEPGHESPFIGWFGRIVGKLKRT